MQKRLLASRDSANLVKHLLRCSRPLGGLIITVPVLDKRSSLDSALSLPERATPNQLPGDNASLDLNLIHPRRPGGVKAQHVLVVVPGIGGSTLEATDGSSAWGHSREVLAGVLVDPARLSLTEHPSLRPVDLLPLTRVLSWKVVPGYDTLVRQLINISVSARAMWISRVMSDGGICKPGARWCSSRTTSGWAL